MSICIRIGPEVQAFLEARKTERLDTWNKVLRDWFGLPVKARIIKPPPSPPRVKGMTAVFADGTRIKVL